MEKSLNSKLNKLLYIEILYKTIMGFLLFINLVVWTKAESVELFYFYFLIYFVYRFFSYSLSLVFQMKFKTTSILRLSFLIGLFQPLLFLFVLNDISNIYLWLSLVALPIGFMNSFYESSFNLILSHYGKEHKGSLNYGNFFTNRVYIGYVVGFVTPLLFGSVMGNLGFEIINYVVIVIIVICLFLSFSIEPLKVNTEYRSFVSLLKGIFSSGNSKSKSISNLLKLHLLYIFIGSFVLQLLDIFRNVYNFTITTDALNIGIINSSVFLLNTILFVSYKKFKNISNVKWFNCGILIITISMILINFINLKYLIFVLILLNIGLFYLNTLYSALTFDLLEEFNSKESFEILVKREYTSLFGKTVFIILGYVIAFNEIRDLKFTILLFILGIFMILMSYLYNKIFVSTKNLKS